MARVSIPAKLMLSGEYAVLYGAPAVLLPVPRFLHVSAGETDGGTPLAELPPALRAALSHPVKRLEELEAEAPRMEFFSIDSSAFFSDEPGAPQKLGLGLSAAECVAGIALRYEHCGLNWQAHRVEVARAAIAAHYGVSGGGSGADCAASAMGRPIVYRLSEDGPQIGPGGGDGALPQPCLPLNCVWSRRSADTRTLLGQFEDWADSGGSETAELLRQLVARSTELAPLWFGTDSAALLSAFDSFCAAMAACAAAAGMAWKLPAHARMEEWARRHGGRAKPTGAGGGDMILLVGDLPLTQLGMDAIALGGQD